MVGICRQAIITIIIVFLGLNISNITIITITIIITIITITIVFLGLNIVMYSKLLGLSRLFDIYFLSL